MGGRACECQDHEIERIHVNVGIGARDGRGKVIIA